MLIFMWLYIQNMKHVCKGVHFQEKKISFSLLIGLLILQAWVIDPIIIFARQSFRIKI